MKSMVLGLVAGLCVMSAAGATLAQEAAPVATAAPAAPAATAEAKALAQRYLDATQFEALMLAAMEPMLDALTAQQPDLSAEDRAMVRGVVLDSMKSVMPAYLDEVANLYGQAMSTEELEALVTFYESPVGRSISTKSLELTNQSQAMFTRFQPTLNAEIMKRMEALQAAGE